MRTAAQEGAPQIALRDCSKQARVEDFVQVQVQVQDFGEGGS